MEMGPFEPVLLQFDELLPSSAMSVPAFVDVMELQQVLSASWMPTVQALMQSYVIQQLGSSGSVVI